MSRRRNRNLDGVPVRRGLLYGEIVGHCERVIQLIRASDIDPTEAFVLEQYVRSLAGATHYIPTQESAERTKMAVRAAGIPVDGKPRGRRLSRAERREEARRDAHKAQVEQLFGERPLLPAERERLAPYEPVHKS